MVGFRSLFEHGISEEGQEVSGKIQSVQIGGDDLAAFFRSGRVRKRGAGTDYVQNALRHIGDK